MPIYLIHILFPFEGKVPFDREEKSIYKFHVFASDGIRFGSSIIKVNVKDRNDERPEFTDGPYKRTVKENEKPGEQVGYVLAKDRDEKENAMITYSLVRGNDRFRIDPNTGLITTRVTLDRESSDNTFKVLVRATDSGSPPLKGETEVTITVQDANDQHPYFEQDSTTVSVLECGAIGDTVTKLIARDNDLGENAKLLFSIARGNTPRRFRIDNNNGVITIAHRLDYELDKKQYNLFVSLRDRGHPRLDSFKNASVIINVKDCNDNAPRFGQATYKTNISEGAVVGTEIIRVSAQDGDEGLNKQFDFHIVDPDENYQFRIRPSPDNPEVGIVSLAWRLDRETLSEHIIKIAARDRGTPSITGYTQLTILVNDVNDNPPVFRPPDYCGHVSEEVKTPGTQQLVATVQITDADDPVKNQCPCTYELEDPYGLFTLDYSKTDNYKAHVKTKPGVVFDRDVKDKQLYKIKVKATDKGGLYSTAAVYVEVGDRDDNPPSSDGHMSFDVFSYKGKIANADIGQVLIVDADRGLKHPYLYHRLEPKSNSFSIDNNGVVKVTKEGVKEGRYKFNVISESSNHTKGVTITSSIDINVKDVSDDVVQNGFPLRMRGLRKHLTCDEIKYIDFGSILSRVLKVDRRQVTVFSVQETRSVYRGVDVWFSIQQQIGASDGDGGGRFMSYMELVMKLSEQKKEIERATGN